MVSLQLISSLKDLGLNTLEAEVYCELLKNNGITAYQLAKALNKATANVYKAVKVLATLGGITIEKSNKELCHAVKPNLFLSSLDACYQKRRIRASQLLDKNRYSHSNAGVYRLDNAQLAIQNAKNSINNAQQSIIIDAFPKILNLLQQELALAVKRGVETYIQCYHDFKLEGAIVVNSYRTKDVVKVWKTEQLNLVVDGKESLVCLFNAELTAVNEATWSNALYLSCVLHVGLRREHFFHQLKEFSEQYELPAALNDLIKQQTNFIINQVLGDGDLESLLHNTFPKSGEIAEIIST